MFYPAALARTQYVPGDTVILSIGYFRAFPYRVALFPWIRIALYIVGKLDSTAWTTWGTFKMIVSTKPSMETSMQNFNYPEKHVPYQLMVVQT